MDGSWQRAAYLDPGLIGGHVKARPLLARSEKVTAARLDLCIMHGPEYEPRNSDSAKHKFKHSDAGIALLLEFHRTSY